MVSRTDSLGPIGGPPQLEPSSKGSEISALAHKTLGVSPPEGSSLAGRVTESTHDSVGDIQPLLAPGNTKWRDSFSQQLLKSWEGDSKPGDRARLLQTTLGKVDEKVSVALQHVVDTFSSERKDPQRDYKECILALRGLGKVAEGLQKTSPRIAHELNQFIGKEYEALIRFKGAHTISEKTILQETFDLKLADTEVDHSSVRTLHNNIDSKIGKLRNLPNWVSKLVTLFRRVMNNVGRFDQIRSGNVPYELGTVELSNGLRCTNIRHGSPIDRARASNPEVTPEFKAWVDSQSSSGTEEGHECGILYISRMKQSSKEGKMNKAILETAQNAGNAKMMALVLPGDGHYYEQKKEFSGDKNFEALSKELVQKMVNDEAGFNIPPAMRDKLLEKYNQDHPEQQISDFGKLMEKMFQEAGHDYNDTLLGKPSLDRDERRALLINFINGPLTEACIEAVKPKFYINSCKENVDRGAVGNSVTAYRLSTPETRNRNFLLVQFTAVLLSKQRSVNANLDNTCLWLANASQSYLEEPKKGPKKSTFTISG